MLTGPRGIIVFLGGVACVVFAGAVAVGGWAAYGAGVAVVGLCTAAASGWLCRNERRLREAMDALARGEGLDVASGGPGRNALGDGLRSLAESIGKAVTPFEGVIFDPGKLEMEQLVNAGWELFMVMFAGGLVFGIPATAATYFLSLIIIRRYRQGRAIRLLRKKTLG